MRAERRREEVVLREKRALFPALKEPVGRDECLFELDGLCEFGDRQEELGALDTVDGLGFGGVLAV